MAGYATTKLSSRGQVVILAEIRNTLGLREASLSGNGLENQRIPLANDWLFG